MQNSMTSLPPAGLSQNSWHEDFLRLRAGTADDFNLLPLPCFVLFKFLSMPQDGFRFPASGDCQAKEKGRRLTRNESEAQ